MIFHSQSRISLINELYFFIYEANSYNERIRVCIRIFIICTNLTTVNNTVFRFQYYPVPTNVQEIHVIMFL